MRNNKCLHTAMPEVHWNGNDTVVLNGSTNGSCIATGNPCPEAEVITLNNCSHHTNVVATDNYTVRVEFMITNITEDCNLLLHIHATIKVLSSKRHLPLFLLQ